MATFEPIGFAHTPFEEKADAPRQPRAAAGVRGVIELLPGLGYEDALDDLGGWSHLWVIFGFDRSEGWRPKVLPPRSATKRGVFATRAPHRPNPIGLSVVQLERVEGLRVFVRDVDLLDGTPVYDLKPYVPWTDAIPGARAGWLEEERPEQAPRAGGARPADPGPSWTVRFTDDAEEQLRFLAERGVELRSRVARQLALGPRPHAYRRIKKTKAGYVLAIRSWRCHFVEVGGELVVERLASGEKPKTLALDEREALDVHRDFVATFGW
ncbi:MAG TPA: tRNA (N6-threonylcarbamoyladenosine(37)-N6)-methyltransferase TrmO [Polyangiaceae bacterium LLY-WYZ-15_(1-7)]|nr:tRNA (N6-threonylcarbamoyladenosine(37)-N6)-methyltransferase TrmO [Myxococcales bacterium]MAT24725.1 tRNA (N6-threonylcarbamoyladenosine(37)-N6)-methyltransferase TrmO [Sandaracinus sp.]HJK91332.1 tRNA (N6-threonylcarbamoyladenosine(37)-N6)-methyltransferase TrmO [Polyangiaceae bacterium LLY-WYZ-15_(1-7)]MBJ72173.1 tRNA (N6-threonylcarbamoyladenosine(37)-N6)-methyltransferase TrmO [Sandaracinus sp.]HJL03882.1 tRNA (N6-threonylcarbamoyladenosine(37)-N6)-methyltransferase TrmO [Polyangiaceae 